MGLFSKKSKTAGPAIAIAPVPVAVQPSYQPPYQPPQVYQPQPAYQPSSYQPDAQSWQTMVTDMPTTPMMSAAAAVAAPALPELPLVMPSVTQHESAHDPFVESYPTPQLPQRPSMHSLPIPLPAETEYNEDRVWEEAAAYGDIADEVSENDPDVVIQALSQNLELAQIDREHITRTTSQLQEAASATLDFYRNGTHLRSVLQEALLTFAASYEENGYGDILASMDKFVRAQVGNLQTQEERALLKCLQRVLDESLIATTTMSDEIVNPMRVHRAS